MKKSNQHRSKQQIIVAQQSQQSRLHKRLSKVPSRELNNSAHLRFFQSHPFSQAQRQQFSFSRVYHRNHTNSRCQPEPKESSRCYIPKSGPSQVVTSQSIVVLQQRLKNIREHYEALINQQKSKNAERSEIIMGLILEMQTTHNEKMELMRKTIVENEEEKKDVGFVDEKMNEIKGNIDELINQSNSLKQQNQELQRQIAEKMSQNEQKQAELEQLNQEVLEARTQLEQFELANLKNNKVNKEIMQIFNSASTLTSD